MLPLYSITYLLHTKTGNFWHILPIVAKNCVCQEISSKSNRRRRFYTTKHVNLIGLSVGFVLRISCCHLTSFSNFYLCLSISVSAYFLVKYLVELKHFERKLTKKNYRTIFYKSQNI